MLRMAAASGVRGGIARDVVDPLRLWVRLCRRRSQLRRKTFPQEAQWYGLMSVCVKRWVFRFDRWLKLRLQTGHLCGDSSMCRILCTASVLDWQNPFPHSRHLKGFSFEWIYLESQNTEVTAKISEGSKDPSYRWSLRWSCLRKALPQISQE